MVIRSNQEIVESARHPPFQLDADAFDMKQSRDSRKGPLPPQPLLEEPHQKQSRDSRKEGLLRQVGVPRHVKQSRDSRKEGDQGRHRAAVQAEKEAIKR